jgi:hypothetical protein
VFGLGFSVSGYLMLDLILMIAVSGFETMTA